MHDAAAKAHLHTWLWGGVQRVVVTIKTVQQRRLRRRLMLQYMIWLLPLGRRESLSRRTFGTTPVALAYIEPASDDTGVNLTASDLDKVSLRLDDGSRLAFVV